AKTQIHPEQLLPVRIALQKPAVPLRKRSQVPRTRLRPWATDDRNERSLQDSGLRSTSPTVSEPARHPAAAESASPTAARVHRSALPRSPGLRQSTRPLATG